MIHNRAEKLNGVTERRSVGLTDFEMRADGNTLKFSGYASLFNSPYEMYGGPEKGGWIEQVDPGAFTRTLAAKPDVVLNMNHGEGGTGLPIARTTSGTLKLATDKKGLKPEASLDLRDPDVQALQVKVDRGDVNQMSFAFRTIRQEWDEEETHRTLMELSLDRGDVSIVTNGANPGTSVQLRNLGEIAATLAAMDFDEAATEVRSLQGGARGDLVAATSLLGRLTRYAMSTGTVEKCSACDTTGMCSTCGGTGNMTNGGTQAKCDACNQTGMCPTCNGVGYTFTSDGNGPTWQSNAARVANEYGAYGERAYNEADRKTMAGTGEAMPDGSYPIKNLVDLHNAIHAVGRGGADHNSIRKHIIARAKALGASDVIPSDWNPDGSLGSQQNSAKPRLSVAQAHRLALLDA